jgi:hypothetical protein
VRSDTIFSPLLTGRERDSMPQNAGESGGLPTASIAKEHAVVLMQSLLVDWKVLEHLHQKGAIEGRLGLQREAKCCKPDGGTCCVNRKPETFRD